VGGRFSGFGAHMSESTCAMAAEISGRIVRTSGSGSPFNAFASSSTAVLPSVGRFRDVREHQLDGVAFAIGRMHEVHRAHAALPEQLLHGIVAEHLARLEELPPVTVCRFS
ncbi:MAG: hypothetical protein IJI36_15340, partial [Kiritimatiellae bacterium]|nr:hypothetical protein [Kiritimatiellia bacterium]